MAVFEPIENIFVNIEGFRCFVCSPENDKGLRLSFFHNRETKETITRLEIPEHLSGFPKVAHGGIQSTVLDELAFWAVFAAYGLLTVTVELRVKFLRTVPVGVPLLGRAKASAPKLRLCKVKATLGPEEGPPCTEGEVLVYVLNEETWEKNFQRPVPAILKPYLSKGQGGAQKPS